MKKLALLAALLCLVGCFCGCMPEEVPVDNPNVLPSTTPEASQGSIPVPEQTTLPGVPSTTPPETPLSQITLSSISTPIVEEAFYAEDNTLLLSYIYQNVFFIHQDVAAADSVFLALANKLDYSNGLQETLQLAKEAYASNPSGWKPYCYQVLFNTMRIDQGIVSIFGEVTTSTEETSSIPISSTYSLVNGKHLSFADIQSNSYHYYNLLLLIDAQLKQSEVADQLFEDYQQTIADKLNSRNFEGWYFSENGLCFYFLPYEIAPNAAGTVVVEVAYSDLTNLIADDYFPAESYITGGAVYAQLFESAEIFRYQNFAEIIQSSQGPEILLSTDGAIADVRLELGTWDATGTTFLPTATIFACDGLSSDSAIVVQCELPDVMPVLRIQYESEGIQHTQFISQSGKDGTILLTNS